MVIQHNIGASNTSRMYNLTGAAISKESEKLSSGFKINRAADDAAGLSISEKMRRQIRGLKQSSTNAEDGVSLSQIADGALTEVHEMLQRGNELAVQAANGTLSTSDRENIEAEIVKIKDEINRITSTTRFNEINVFDKAGTTPKLRTISGTTAEQRAVDNLALKIQNEYFPNAVSQILEKIPSLGNKMKELSTPDKTPYNTKLKLDYIDGGSGTMAFMQASFSGTNQNLVPSSLLMKVDKEDFPSIKMTDTQKGQLESTIAHEVMHGVMDATFPKRMCPDGGAEDFPLWFIEGTAQLTGGGFSSGWNYGLTSIVKNLSGPDDTSLDSAISAYLTSYSVDSRVYGHGYLAAAYASHLASNYNSVTSEALLQGTSKMFSSFMADEKGSFNDVFTSAVGVSPSDLKNAINSGSYAPLTPGKMSPVEFVRKLAYNSLPSGYGSITSGLQASGTDMLGTTAVKYKQPMEITSVETYLAEIEHTQSTDGSYLNVSLHLGPDADMTNKQEITLYNMNCNALTIEKTSVLTEDSATDAIDEFGKAILIVSGVRSYFGAIQNRLEHTIRNLDNVVENTQAAESRIRDTNMADEMVKYSKDKILAQAGESMLAQANSSMESVISLLK